MKVGVAGLGMMGAAIAQRLIEVGHAVTVWNRNADKVTPVVAAGATAAATPTALASECEVIITILTDAAAIDAVAGLIERMGYDAVRLDSLRAGRLLEPGGPVFGAALSRAEFELAVLAKVS